MKTTTITMMMTTIVTTTMMISIEVNKRYLSRRITNKVRKIKGLIERRNENENEKESPMRRVEKIICQGRILSRDRKKSLI